MRVSHSKIETFLTCPFKYKLRYLDKLETLPNTDANNALIMGTALHTGIEKGVKEGLRAYFESYPILDDLQINEGIKLEYLIPKVRELVPEGTIFEQVVNCDGFVGFIDALVPVSEDGMFKTFDLYDFKYSNHVDRYLESPQLHLYKYFYEKAHPYHKIRNLAFIFAPKTAIRQKKTEELAQFRKRLLDTLETLEVKTVSVNYDPNKVIEFLQNTLKVVEATEFPKNECKLCDFCDYKDYCLNGVDYMLLPSTSRRVINAASRKKIWLYGAPFSGKTTLADHFPTPIMLNTDGNINSFTAPMIEIREKIEGRQTIPAWAVFKDAIETLQKGSDFQTIVVDLVEDTFEHCRLYCYDKLGIEHESDNSFKAWDYVRTEFLSTMKRLMTLDYNIVLISHEDLTKDITRKSGDKITAIKPNIQDKTALKLAGMVDIVARVVADGDDRSLQFKSDDVVFGGGRLKLHGVTHIPLTYEALEALYESQDVKTVRQPEVAKTEGSTNGNDKVEAEKQSDSKDGENVGKTAEPTPRRRRRKTAETTESKTVENEQKEVSSEHKVEPEQPTQTQSEGQAETKAETVTYDSMVNYAREVCKKYDVKELQARIYEKFGVMKFNDLKPEQYADALDVIKAFEAEKQGALF